MRVARGDADVGKLDHLPVVQIVAEGDDAPSSADGKPSNLFDHGALRYALGDELIIIGLGVEMVAETRCAEILRKTLHTVQRGRRIADEEFEPRHPLHVGNVSKRYMAAAIELPDEPRIVVLFGADDAAGFFRIDLDACLRKHLQALGSEARPDIGRVFCALQISLRENLPRLPVVEHGAVAEDARRRDRQSADIAARRLGRAPRRNAKKTAARDKSANRFRIRRRNRPPMRHDRTVQVADQYVIFVWLHCGVLLPVSHTILLP